MQSLDPARSRELLTYYSRVGPAGSIFSTAQARSPQSNWAVIGLGTGAISCYLQPGQNLTYYEIDPLVARIAKDTRWFTFLNQCAPSAKIVLGDARLELRSAPDAEYDVIALDAFSGDSIPMHLLTREALALYLRKLAPGGILAFHISNIYLDLAPTLGALANDAHLAGRIEVSTLLQTEIDQGKFPSIWVVMSRSEVDLATLGGDDDPPSKWLPLPARPGAKVWTDDFSNQLSAIRWH
jgi:spermidine synthase